MNAVFFRVEALSLKDFTEVDLTLIHQAMKL